MNNLRKSIVIASLAMMSGLASADVVIGAVNASSSGSGITVYSDAQQIHNQSGLSANYVSGVTDFSDFVSTTTSESVTENGASNMLGTSRFGSFYFDLGQEYDINSIATWGQRGSATVLSYNLYTNNQFGQGSSRTLIGNFSAGNSPSAFSHTFDIVSTQFLEIDVTQNSGYLLGSRLNEVVFAEFKNAADVSSPAKIALLSMGLFGFLSLRKKK